MSYLTTQFAVTVQGDQFKFLFTDGRVFYTNRSEASFTLQAGTTFVEVEDSTGIHTVSFPLCTSPVAVTFAAWVDAVMALTTSATIGTVTLATSSTQLGTVGSVAISGSGSTGGYFKRHVVSAATTNATSIRNGAGKVCGLHMTNNDGTNYAYLKFHNTGAVPTPGVNVVETFGIPPMSYITHNLDAGSPFTAGIGITITGGAADSDTTAVALNQVVGDIYWIA